jgi:predicted alpha/beta-fold hydrolase
MASQLNPPTFAPARWLPGAHLQTIYGSLFAPAPRLQMRRERWDTPDGDFVDVDFLDGPEGAPWLHLFHGLEGSSESTYARMLIDYVKRRGWRASVLNFRGRSGEANRMPRAYHSGDSDEIDWVLRRISKRVGEAPLYVVGVSLGGNALAKWLGENGEAARAIVARAVAVSAPMDLMAAGDALESGLAIFYARHFLTTLKKNSLAKLERFPGLFDAAAVARARTLREFDNAFTAPVHGFRDCDDYYVRSSCKPFLPRVRVPTLIVNARDDPFLPESALPSEREVSDAVKLEFPASGGHVGFVSGPYPGNIEWLPRRILHFLEHHE